MTSELLSAAGWWLSWIILFLTILTALILTLNNLKDEQAEKSKLSYNLTTKIWIFNFILLVLLSPVFFYLKPHIGSKGAFLTFIAGFLIPSVVFTLQIFNLKKPQTQKSTKSNSSILVLFTLGLILPVCGIISRFYGITAVGLWIYLILGLSLNLLWIKIAARKQTEDQLILISVEHLEYNLFLGLAVITALILGSYHFASGATGAWMPFYLGCFLFLSYYLTILVVIFKDNIYKSFIWQIIFSSLIFLALSFWLIFNTTGNLSYFYSLLLGQITSVLILVLINSSVQIKKELDLTVAVFIILFILGIFWSAFKLALGFGLCLSTIGLLSSVGILTNLSLIEEFQKLKLNLGYYFTKIIGLASAACLMLVIFRMFMQTSKLYLEQINLTDGNFIIGIILGIFLPFFFEATGLLNPYRAKGVLVKNIINLIINYLLLLILAFFGLFCVALFLDIYGIAASLIGLATGAVVSIFVWCIVKNQHIWETDLLSLWIAWGAAAFILYPYIKNLTIFTRLQKIEVLSVFIVLVLIITAFNLTKKEKTAIDSQ